MPASNIKWSRSKEPLSPMINLSHDRGAHPILFSGLQPLWGMRDEIQVQGPLYERRNRLLMSLWQPKCLLLLESFVQTWGMALLWTCCLLTFFSYFWSRRVGWEGQHIQHCVCLSKAFHERALCCHFKDAHWSHWKNSAETTGVGSKSKTGGLHSERSCVYP